jgi:ectoine hydroxylase-related dioxygenase (phytanoyl-CoA dioxygenase family)
MKLSGDELKLFEMRGWIGPFTLVDDELTTVAYEQYTSHKNLFHWPTLKDPYCYDLTGKLHWFKSLHCHLPGIAGIVSHPRLVAMVTSLLGENVMAWGATVTVRAPDQLHRWHGDIEHYKWTGLSVFIGLKNTSVLSSLKVIPGSHKWSVPPQTFGDLSERDVLQHARKYDPMAEVVNVPCNDGECFIFAGRLWHASDNKSKKTRMALIAQYANTNQEIFIPPNYNIPVRWDDRLQPICLLVSGLKGTYQNIYCLT